MSTFPISRNEEHLKKWRSTLNNEVLKSPCTPVAIPEETLVERILRSLKAHAYKFPRKAAVIEAFNQDRSLTYQQIHDRALSFAAFLTSHGLSIGDRVNVALPNSIEWPVLHLGIWAAGGAVVGSDPGFVLNETVCRLRDTSSSVVVVSEQMLDMVMEAAKLCPTVMIIICIRSSKRPLPTGIIDFEDAIQYEPLNKIANVPMDTACMILASSGTTGTPKGIVHTHRSYHCSVKMLRSHWEHEIYPVLGVGEVDYWEETQVVVTGCAYFSGFTLLNLFLLTGSPVALLREFDTDIYLQAIEKFRPRYLFVTPPQIVFLAKDPKGRKAPMSSVQMTLCGTAALSQEISNEFQACHPNVKYNVQAYGLSETGNTHLPLLLEEGVDTSGGVLISYYEQKIVNLDTLETCKQGQRGELWVRGPPQTIGYWNDPEATKALIDEQGWLHTGDICYIDELGRLFIVDRVKDLITVLYFNQIAHVAPAELEGILLSHRKIREAAIVGVITDNESDHLIRAFVVKADETLTAKDVENMISEKLDEWKHINGGVSFVEKIPRTPTGKILRRVLRK